MTTIKYLSKSQMTKRTGMKNALGYADPKNDTILLRKGMPKKVEMKVRAHEAEHIERGEEGPFIGAIVGSVLGGVFAKKAAKKSANAITQAGDQATAEERRQFDIMRADTAPYREAGINALGAIQDPSQFQVSPEYDFLRSEGTRDIGNSFAARGGAASGNALRALSEYNQGLASREYGNWWERQARVAGLGGAATNTSAQIGAGTAAGIGRNAMVAGDARASGVLGQNEALQNVIGAGVDWWNQRNQPNSMVMRQPQVRPVYGFPGYP